MIVGSPAWQESRYLSYMYDKSDELEFTIREMAGVAAAAHTTYTGGTVFPYYPLGRGMVDRYGGSPAKYYQVVISLHPQLERHPKIAALIAEDVIRFELEKCGAIQPSNRRVVYPFKWERKPSTFGEEIVLSVRIDGTILSYSQLIGDQIVDNATSAGELKDYVKRSMSHRILHAIGEHLGLEL